MLAPIPNLSHQDSSSIRNQQHHSLKLPVKLRKSHDNDSSQHKPTIKITRKSDDDHTQAQIVPSPVEQQPQQDKTNELSKY
jgi:hypothetical protein